MTTASPPRITEKPAQKATVHRPWWRTTIEPCLLAILAIAVMEALFRFCGVGGQEFLEPDPVLGCRQIPNKQVTWRLEGYSNDTLSSTGRRDVEHNLTAAPGATRIAVLGDSATEGLQVSLKETYCRVLERLLNSGSKSSVEVMNFGCSSYSTGQQVLQFEQQVLQYHPQITVLLYVRGAALQNSYNPYKRAAEPRPYFYLDGQGVLKQDDSILHEQAASMRPNPMLAFLRENSRIYGVFSQANLSLSIHEKLYNKIRGWIASLQAKLQPASKAGSQRILYPPPDVWPVTKALLHRLNEDCKANGSKLVVMVFPNTVGDPIQAQQTPDLEKFSKQEQFGLLDLTGAFKANPDPNSLFLQYHFSAAGHKLTAEQLVEYLTNKN